MDHLDGTSVEEPRRALERVDGTRARRRLLRARFDADYSPSSCRRFMREAGLEYRRSQRRWLRGSPDDVEPHGPRRADGRGVDRGADGRGVDRGADGRGVDRGADGRGVDRGADGRGDEPPSDESRWPPVPSASGGNDRGSATSASGSPQGT